MQLTWNELYAQVQQCEKCRLCSTRNHVVFGAGNEQALLMFVGEGPGAQEDAQGQPFVGAAGGLLNDLLTAVGIDREDVYIANIVKCRPPGNRDPKPDEQEACLGYLRSQVQLIQPKLLVCLGRIAACRIIDADFRITKQHGVWFHRKSMDIMATYHPSALLRDISKRPDAFADFMEIQKKYQTLRQDSVQRSSEKA